MSRLGGDLSVREKGKGGSVTDFVLATPLRWVERESRIVLLVHGYNNTFCAGCVSYAHFLKRVPRGFPIVGRFFWPGDTRPAFISGVAYPLKIAAARESAGRLAEFLESVVSARSVPVEINLVGHSLGCRLILETLLAGKGTRLAAHVRSITLMAAAVPVHFLRENGHLYDEAITVAGRLVLHSTDDRVLKWMFPMGQCALSMMPPANRNAREASFEAVGRHGRPSGFATASARMAGNGHSDYWSDPRIFRHLAPMMGAAVERTIERRPLPSHETPRPVDSYVRRLTGRRISPMWSSDCDECV